MPLNIKNLRIKCLDFQNLGRMRDEHAGNKGNVVPRFEISGVPEAAVELAVICHDPDAPLARGFTHWTVYAVPSATTDLSDSRSRFRTGPNGLGNLEYFGPQPPTGHGPHHYYFWVYALDINVSGTPTREEFLDRYKDNIIEQNRTVGIYEN